MTSWLRVDDPGDGLEVGDSLVATLEAVTSPRPPTLHRRQNFAPFRLSPPWYSLPLLSSFVRCGVAVDTATTNDAMFARGVREVLFV